MGLFAKFFTVGGATLASRFLGFFREALIAFMLGAGPVADAFYAAFRFPNLFRRLFAEGAFNSAFVPMFSRELERGDKWQAKIFAENILGFLTVILLVLTALAELFMPWLMATIIAPKFSGSPEKFNLTIELARIMFPFLLCMSITAMLSGILNTLQHYFVAAIAPVILNIILTGALLLACRLKLDPVSVGRVLAWGVTSAGILQLTLVYHAAFRKRFAPVPKIPVLSPKVKKLLLLAAPVALTGGITQINLLVGQIIASSQNGAIAILNYADRIYQLPLGVVGIAIGVVLLPELTRALTSHNSGEALRLQRKSLEFALLLTLPASAGLFFLPGPIVIMLYERGAFSGQTTVLTASALAAFAVGLPSFVLQKVFQPVYFAHFNTRWPMWFALASAIANIAGSLLLFPVYGHTGIAIATSTAGWLNALLLIAGLSYGKTFFLTRQTTIKLIKILVSSAIMGTMLFFAEEHIIAIMENQGFPVRLAIVTLSVSIAATFYFGLLALSGGVSLKEIRSFLSKRKQHLHP